LNSPLVTRLREKRQQKQATRKGQGTDNGQPAQAELSPFELPPPRTRLITPFRAILAGIVLIIGVTGYGIWHSRQIEKAEVTLKTASEAGQQLLEEGDLVGANSAYQQASEAVDILGRHDRQAFDVQQTARELEALNRTLDQNNMTVDTFLLLHKEHPEKAKLAYRLAQPALLKAKEYKICGEYLEPEKSYQLLVRTREANQQLAKNPQIGPGILEFSDKHFSNQTAILVALLVVNDRREEARSIAEKARKEWDNADFHKALDSALAGTVPPSWPY
jgi:hypothetical protein